MATAKFQHVKVMGERGTGTNFVTHMINANFEAQLLLQPDGATIPGVSTLHRTDVVEYGEHSINQRVEDYQHATGLDSFGGWKHACLTDRLAARQNVLFICVLRHPAPWAVSLHKRPFSTYLEAPETVEAFLSQPWVTRPRDEIADLVLDGPALLWKLKTESYLDQARRRANVVVLRHEDFLRDHLAVLEGLEQHLTPKDDTWKLLTSYARTFMADGPGFWDIRAALPDDPWTVISVDAAHILRTQIGARVIQDAGYTP